MFRKGLHLRKIFFGLWFLLAMDPAEARFATLHDAPTEIQGFNRTIEVKADGRSQTVIEMSIKVLNESGRSNFATQPLMYDESTQKLKILSAKTIDEGVEYSVDQNSIEDRQVASQATGFSSYRQVLVSYPRVHVGSVLYLKYELDQVQPDLKGAFSAEFVYGREGYWTQSEVKVVSQIPLNIRTNDPEKYLDVKVQESVPQTLTISLKRPVIKQLMEEEGPLDYKNFPWVSVSSFKDWSELAQRISPEYEKVLKKPLPPFFEAMAKEVELTVGTSLHSMRAINLVTSLLAEKIRYMGDWRTISGRFYPHSLDQMAQDRNGDCKDFATLTSALLRRLGFQADPALVRRGGFYGDPTDIPSLGAFDHAIVRVRLEGKDLWVDPTNFVSFAHGLFPDIEDRWALPLSLSSKGRERIPAADPEKNQMVLRQNVHFLSQREVRVDGTFEEKGATAIGLTGASLRTSPQNIEYQILSTIDWVEQMKSWKFKPYTLNSRVVVDVLFEFEYEKTGAELKTNGGRGYPLQHRFLPAILARTQTRVGDLHVMFQPCVLRRVTMLRKAHLKGRKSLNCRLQSPWLDVSREIVQKSSGIEVDDSFKFKKALIPHSDLLTPEFLKFQQNLENCMSRVALMFEL